MFNMANNAYFSWFALPVHLCICNNNRILVITQKPVHQVYPFHKLLKTFTIFCYR